MKFRKFCIYTCIYHIYNYLSLSVIFFVDIFVGIFVMMLFISVNQGFCSYDSPVSLHTMYDEYFLLMHPYDVIPRNTYMNI